MDNSIGIDFCFITVDDHDKALGFYRDLLGFEVVGDIAFDDLRWVSVKPPASEVKITLMGTKPAPDFAAEDTEALRRLLAKGVLNAVVLRTDDVDALFEHLQAGGAEVIQEPMDQHYGVRDCAFRDPAGNMIRFNQPLAR